MIPCPEPACCGASMIARTNKINQSTFLGCSNYPACTATLPIPESVRMREAGAMQLPGFETVAAGRPGGRG